MNSARHDDGWWVRFSLGAVILVALNVVPYLFGSADEFGSVALGWPFWFWEYQVGLVPTVRVCLPCFVVDAALVGLGGAAFASVSRGGLRAAVHRLRTWGTPWA